MGGGWWGGWGPAASRVSIVFKFSTCYDDQDNAADDGYIIVSRPAESWRPSLNCNDPAECALAEFNDPAEGPGLATRMNGQV